MNHKQIVFRHNCSKSKPQRYTSGSLLQLTRFLSQQIIISCYALPLPNKPNKKKKSIAFITDRLPNEMKLTKYPYVGQGRYLSAFHFVSTFVKPKVLFFNFRRG